MLQQLSFQAYFNSAIFSQPISNNHYTITQNDFNHLFFRNTLDDGTIFPFLYEYEPTDITLVCIQYIPSHIFCFSETLITLWCHMRRSTKEFRGSRIFHCVCSTQKKLNLK